MCGEDSLDGYLRQRAKQDDDRNVARVFVLYDTQDGRIAGYYTLTSSSVPLEDLPPEMRRKLPRYPHVPVVLLGRLAVDEAYQGQRLGELLLAAALRLAFVAASEHVAATAVVVDALHDQARSFYERYGFLRFPDHEHRLYLPLQAMARLIDDNDG